MLSSVVIRVGNSLFGSLSKLLFFCEQKSERAIHSEKTNNSLFRFFLKSDLNESLMVAFL